VIVAFPENDRHERTVCLCQILVKLRKKGTEIFSMFKIAFRGQTVGRTQVI
jgi:hypothetical protein